MENTDHPTTQNKTEHSDSEKNMSVEYSSLVPVGFLFISVLSKFSDHRHL